jgi:hypothetical protein
MLTETRELSASALGYLRATAAGKIVVVLGDPDGAATVACAQPTARVCAYAPRSLERDLFLAGLVAHRIQLVSDSKATATERLILHRWDTPRDDEQTSRRGTYTRVTACVHLLRPQLPAPPAVYNLAVVLDGNPDSLTWAAGACERPGGMILWRGEERHARRILVPRGYSWSGQHEELMLWSH